MSIRNRIILIITAALAVYLVGNGSVALWDRDEPRYAQTSRQMLQSGDWVVPHLLDKVRTAKPIFIYWCQASAMRVFGDNEFAARFPSSIAMTGTLLMLAIVIYRTIGARRALWTVFILATSGLVIAAAKMCLTDSVLLLFVTAAQVCLATIYAANHDILPRLPKGARWAIEVLDPQGTARRGRRMTLVPVIMWIAIGFAGLTKGPVVIGVSLTTMFLLAMFDATHPRSGFFIRRATAWWSRTRPLLGIVIVAVICAPWLILIHKREPAFLPTILGHDVIERMRTGLEGHRGPPGYYLLLIWGTFFPWSLLLPAALIQAWKRRHIPIIRFALAGTIGPWVMFEIIQTKLPHYVLPIFPCLAFLTADMLIRAGRKLHNEVVTRGFVRVVAVWVAIVILVSAAPWLSLKFFNRFIDNTAIWSMFILTLLAVEYARQVYVYFRANRPLDAAAVMGIGMLALVAVLYVGFLPHAAFLRTSQRVADTLKDFEARDVIMIDYKEDSLPWCQGGTIRAQRDNDFLLHNPPESWPRFIVLTGEVWRKTPFEIQRQFDELRRVRGWAYSDNPPSGRGPGRVVDVFLLRKKM